MWYCCVTFVLPFGVIKNNNNNKKKKKNSDHLQSQNGVLTTLCSRLLHASRLAVCLRLKPVVVTTATSVYKRLATLCGRVVVVAFEVAATWACRGWLVTHFCSVYDINHINAIIR